MTRYLLAFIVFCGASSAWASDANKKFYVVGAGSLPCSRYVAATDQQKIFAETWWAGYVTAANRLTPDTYNLLNTMTVDDVNAALMSYCQKNPNEVIATAFHKILEAFYANRQKTSP